MTPATPSLPEKKGPVSRLPKNGLGGRYSTAETGCCLEYRQHKQYFLAFNFKRVPNVGLPP